MKRLLSAGSVRPAVTACVAAVFLCLPGLIAAADKADVNGDAKVDAADAQDFLARLGRGAPPSLDLDGDGKTTLADALRYGRWVDGLAADNGAGLGSLYFRDQAESAAFADYRHDAAAKSGWTPADLRNAYPDRAIPFVPIAGPAEFETEVGDAFAALAPGLDKTAFMNRVKRDGLAVATGAGYGNFFQALDQIHDKDLPLLFTTDALLHTLHLSYDSILARVEEQRLIPALGNILDATAAYARRHYAQDASGADVALLLGVAQTLLDPQRSDVPSAPGMSALLSDIRALELKQVSLWGRDTAIDFSQFKVRGHYTRSPKLGAYFQAMMWLSRADLAFDLRAGATVDPAAYTRMKRDAVILWDCLVNSGAYAQWLDMERILGYMVGQSDGLNPKGMGLLLHSLGVADARAFVAAFPEARFDSAVAAARFGAQAILSQDKDYPPQGDDPDLSPIFSFMPQRFILDSFTFSQLVHPVSPLVPWPSPLQISFVLGDNSSLADLPATGAAINGVLAAQRKLYDGISAAGWGSNLYTGWLGFLRKLNAAAANPKVAPVFRSPAFALKARNTQLASWAQLRHNTLLYAKQSYTGVVTCDFPKAYVEPFPDFFAAVAAYADLGARVFSDDGRIHDYFAFLGTTAGRLRDIAGRAAQGLGPDSAQAAWLRAALTYRKQPLGCTQVKVYDGWFLDLIYASTAQGMDGNYDAVIADVHTRPMADDIGPRGVLHVGTGPVQLAAVAIQSDSCTTIYAAPVLSFYEVERRGTLDRLTDETWRDSLRAATAKPARPEWVRPILFP